MFNYQRQAIHQGSILVNVQICWLGGWQYHINNFLFTFLGILIKFVIIVYQHQVSSWSCGSWIYNYLWHQCLLPLMLWVRIPFRGGVLDTTLCVKVCHWLAVGWWFCLGTSISSSNKIDHHDITEILLKVALYFVTLTLAITFGDIKNWPKSRTQWYQITLNPSPTKCTNLGHRHLGPGYFLLLQFYQ